jgi:hypothetical protein
MKNKVAAEFFFPSFVFWQFEEKIFFEKKAKKHQSINFFRVLFFRCVKVYSQRDYLYYWKNDKVKLRKINGSQFRLLFFFF